MAEATQANAAVGIRWLFSFLSADKKKTYCLYEATSAEAIRDAARRLNVSADVIVNVLPGLTLKVLGRERKDSHVAAG